MSLIFHVTCNLMLMSIHLMKYLPLPGFTNSFWWERHLPVDGCDRAT